MTDRWSIVIEAWPHSTGAGSVRDQEECGNRVRHFEVDAGSFKEAVQLANAVAMGVQSGPNCWQAVITGIKLLKVHTIPKGEETASHTG